MGRLAFGAETVTLDDRLLAHLEVVMVTKLRRREPFILTWTVDPSLGSGRVSRWVGVSTSWDVRYHSRSTGPLNPAWIESLMATANSPSGLRIVPEPEPDEDEQVAGL
ncbi:hypothetical protein [Microbacterium oleivorans]|uniref:DUF7882 family protein n=1 Tax=Microbacterium TaxID=33882 RepID=UPI00203D2E56|nr:hypothetical protein [Microbacterium oleivorans]MCM3695419.1 hypothetical protein [Microbacterium oleivorans]